MGQAVLRRSTRHAQRSFLYLASRFDRGIDRPRLYNLSQLFIRHHVFSAYIVPQLLTLQKLYIINKVYNAFSVG